MAFERDLGYLDKFFDNLDAHAATLGGEGGARLKQLVGEERARWGEIKSLLGAPASKKAAPVEKDVKAKSEDVQSAKGPPAAASVSPSVGFTVGSLRGR